MTEPAFLGTVTVPSGVLTVLDMGLLGPWRIDASEHRAALEAALARGEHAFEVAGIAGVGIAGVPRDRPLPVFGVRLEGGEAKNLWQAIFIDIVPGAEAGSTLELGSVTVDTARLMLADADALAAWVHDETVDGLADFVFWGRDAEGAATATNALALGEDTFGWVDLPYDAAVERGMGVEQYRDDHGLLFATDFRPHSHHHAMLAQMRESPTESGTLEVGAAALVAFFTMWGDGQFPVLLDLDAEGNPTRCGIYFATKQAMRNLDAANHAAEFDEG